MSVTGQTVNQYGRAVNAEEAVFKKKSSIPAGTGTDFAPIAQDTADIEK